MKELGPYDPITQMFVEAPKDPIFAKLRYQRHRAERGDFGYKPLSVPMGVYTNLLSDRDIFRYAMQQGDKELIPTPEDKPSGT